MQLFILLLVAIVCTSCKSTRPPVTPLPPRVVTVTSSKVEVDSVQQKSATTVARTAAAVAAATVVRTRVDTVREAAGTNNAELVAEMALLKEEADILQEAVARAETAAAEQDIALYNLSVTIARVELERNTAWLEREQVRAAAERSQAESAAREAVSAALLAERVVGEKAWRKRALYTWGAVAGIGLLFVLVKLRA